MDLVTGAIGIIISKLADLLKVEYNLQSSVKEQIESLTKELKSAQAFLQDIDKLHPDQLDEQVKLYASEVREASYDMEDVLDTFLVSVQGPEPIEKKKKQLINQLKEKMASFFSKTAARHGIAGAIDDIMKRLQEVTERRGRYTVDSIITIPSPSSAIDPRLAAMYKQVTQIIGIDKPRDELSSLLLSQGNEMSKKKLKIVSVIGVGGLGKTTLAKALYDNLKAQFNCSAFVPVGRNPDLKKVLRDILIELDKDKYTESKFTTLDVRQLINELRFFLERKRYFIVIDDIWDIKSWETVNLALVENNNGSRIIITTRNSNVGTGEVYKLQPLSDYNSKKLLYARIFGEDKCPNQQQQKVSKVADKILKKCGGVPLAIITMASLLVGKSMEEWLEVCNSIGFCDKDKDHIGDTMWILSLSYYDLPSHLKTCLLYLSVFPEDYLIEKDALIWMWIGEGFVNEKTEFGLFEIGEGYFNDLINRSLIQPVEKKMNRIVVGCRVHDMVLDLIRSLSRKANFAIVPYKGEDTRNARRLSFQNGRVVEVTHQDNHMYDKARGRSLIAFKCSFSWVPLQSLKHLRVLHLEDCHIEGYDEQIGGLLHLRFLGKRNTIDSGLLKELGAPKFLQVLYLDGKMHGLLPSSVGMLTQLVCLRAPSMRLPCETIKDLTSLQELQIDPTQDDDKSRHQFVKDLGNLRELRVLKISIDGMNEGMQLDLLKSLGNLHKLQCLQLYFYEDPVIEEATWTKGLPLFPQGLCQLDIPIAGYVLPACIHPSRLLNLSHLNMYMDSIDDQGLKILGGLPELRYLELTIFDDHKATLPSTVAHVYFKKLRSCLLPVSMVHFVLNEEDSSVSFYSLHGPHPPPFGSKKEQDNGRVARTIMPNLEVLYFEVYMKKLTSCENGSCDNLGLECLASLQQIRVDLLCHGALTSMVKKEEAALRHTIREHPNQPKLEIKFYS